MLRPVADIRRPGRRWGQGWWPGWDQRGRAARKAEAVHAHPRGHQAQHTPRAAGPRRRVSEALKGRSGARRAGICVRFTRCCPQLFAGRRRPNGSIRRSIRQEGRERKCTGGMGRMSKTSSRGAGLSSLLFMGRGRLESPAPQLYAMCAFFLPPRQGSFSMMQFARLAACWCRRRRPLVSFVSWSTKAATQVHCPSSPR